MTNENSEIFIYKKDEESRRLVEINRVSIHMKGLVYCYYLDNNRAVSIGYEDSHNTFMTTPNYEKPIEMYYWDTTD